ncbi:MAG TPA: FapA family protein [Chloroflexota bacterium]|jgi:hypothetical protein
MANEFLNASPKDTSDAAPSPRAVPPVPPVDDRIELVVPIPIAPKSGDVQGRRQVVRAGTVLARRIRGTPGKPGTDVLGRMLPVRVPREARLPQGPHTLIGEGGTQLLAACDGEVRMRNLLVEVHPMIIHEGDVLAGAFVIHPDASLFITGSVGESACVEAGGDICIQGHVREASIVSRGGNLSVMGSVIGTAQQPATLEATGDITCGPMWHGRAAANRDVHLLAEAWQSVLHMGGNLLLDQQVEQSLRDVLLEVEGGIFPRVQFNTPSIPQATERQHVRVSTNEPAWLAPHTAPPLQFQACTLLDLSANGARLRLESPNPDFVPESLVQIKFKLPATSEQTLGVARVVRVVSPEVVSVAFLQITQRDQNYLTTFLMRLHMSRPGAQAALRDRRAASHLEP